MISQLRCGSVRLGLPVVFSLFATAGSICMGQSAPASKPAPRSAPAPVRSAPAPVRPAPAPSRPASVPQRGTTQQAVRPTTPTQSASPQYANQARPAQPSSGTLGLQRQNTLPSPQQRNGVQGMQGQYGAAGSQRTNGIPGAASQNGFGAGQRQNLGTGAPRQGGVSAASLHSPVAPRNVAPERLAGGGARYTDHIGRTFITAPNGHVTEFRDQNHVANYDASGRARFIQTTRNGATTSVSHGAPGQRVIQTRYADGTRVVSYGLNHGFAERPVPGRNGFVSRTYAYGGQRSTYVYRSSTYMNHTYYRYVPASYYRPEFYGWAATPWNSPIAYSWGAQPWLGFYGGYFTPYPSYATADLWLTDFILNAGLQQAYAARLASPADPQSQYDLDSAVGQGSGVQTSGAQGTVYGGGGTYGDGSAPAPTSQGSIYGPAPAASSSASSATQLDPAVKALIAQQVKTDLAEMQAASSNISKLGNANADAALPPDNAAPEVLKPDHTTFQVSTDLQLPYGENQTCALTAGDILFRRPDSTMSPDGTVSVTVVGRKPGSCNLNTSARLNVATLEEMNNEFEQQLQTGLGVIAAKHGGPFPEAPATGQIQLAAGQAPAVDVNPLLAQNQASGEQAEQEVASATTGSN